MHRFSKSRNIERQDDWFIPYTARNTFISYHTWLYLLYLRTNPYCVRNELARHRSACFSTWSRFVPIWNALQVLWLHSRANTRYIIIYIHFHPSPYSMMLLLGWLRYYSLLRRPPTGTSVSHAHVQSTAKVHRLSMLLSIKPIKILW